MQLVTQITVSKNEVSSRLLLRIQRVHYSLQDLIILISDFANNSVTRKMWMSEGHSENKSLTIERYCVLHIPVAETIKVLDKFMLMTWVCTITLKSIPLTLTQSP